MNDWKPTKDNTDHLSWLWSALAIVVLLVFIVLGYLFRL